jgi:hypothetical protein
MHLLQTETANIARKSAAVGALVWFALLFVPIGDSHETELIQKVLLFGILVIVPLGLSVVKTPKRDGSHSVFYFLAVIGQPLAAIAALTSFMIAPGIMAGLLAGCWFLVDVLIAVFGGWRFLQRGLYPMEESCLDAGLVYLPVGGVWLIASRLGIQLFGFGDTIVLLTAVHFHFAGFAAPVITGLTGRVLARSTHPVTLFRLAAASIVVGIPLVAAGITFSPVLALIGAGAVSLGLTLLAALTIGWALAGLRSFWQQCLLTISSLASVSAMALACAYAYSIVTRTVILDIPTMAMSHGLLNAFGFATFGLLVWSVVEPGAISAPPGIPFSKLPARSFTGPGYFEHVGAIAADGPQPLGLVDDFSAYGRSDFDTKTIHPTVRSFYEETFRFKLVVRPQWRVFFKPGGRLAHWLGTRVGQLCLPIAAEKADDLIESRLVPLAEEVDGRKAARGWIRVYQRTGQAMYVAAYSSHSHEDHTYMNIAFPLPGGSLSSVLHIGASKSQQGQGVILSTLPSVQLGGDQGVYFANPVLPFRLPMNETITVWPPSENGESANAPVLKAKHEMWFCGINFLNLDYDIFGVP